MLLTVDIGNTNIVLGVYDGDTLLCSGRLHTATEDTELDYLMKLRAFFEANGVGDTIDGAIIASVVPVLVRVFRRCINTLCGTEPLIVGPGIKTGINIKIDNPAELGADLLVADVAVAAKYKLPAAIFDFGTATTASVLSADASHLGGIIACGAKTGLKAITESAAQLPDIGFKAPSHLIATNTPDALRGGSLIGSAAMMEGLVSRFEKELGDALTVVVTGGVGRAVARVSTLKVIYDENLILDGLKLLYDKNTLLPQKQLI